MKKVKEKKGLFGVMLMELLFIDTQSSKQRNPISTHFDALIPNVQHPRHKSLTTLRSAAASAS